MKRQKSFYWKFPLKVNTTTGNNKHYFNLPAMGSRERVPNSLEPFAQKNNYIWHLANTQILVPIKWLYCCTRKTKFMHWLQQNIWPSKDLRFTVSFVMVMLVKAIEYNRITRYLQLLYYSIDSFHLQLDSQQKNTPHKIITCS